MKTVVWLVILVSACCLTLQAIEVPPAKGYVSDYASMLTSSEVIILNQKLQEHEAKTSNQVVVLTINSLEGEAIESFGIKVAEKWKPGQKGKDNGVLFIIAKEDRRTRIEVGYGLEGALTDLECALILDNIVKPKFRESKYYEGINAAIESIFKAIEGEFTPETKTSDIENTILFLLGLLLISSPLLAVLLSHTRKLSGNSRGGSWWSTGGGGWSGGGGSGGGFSGGGGGFGGGGASGRW